MDAMFFVASRVQEIDVGVSVRAYENTTGGYGFVELTRCRILRHFR